MKDIPGIGVVRGVFDIFVPGVFLLLHVIIAGAAVTDAVPSFAQIVRPVTSSPLLGAAAFLCFGYLFGMLLRLLKTEGPDWLSGRFLFLCWGRKWPGADEYLREGFPYFEYLKHLSGNKLPQAVARFYAEYWEPQNASGGNRQFFNYCKALVNAVDERSGAEAYVAEAITRYVSSMFYALLGALVLVALLAILIPCPWLWGVVGLYLVAELLILRNLRLLRFKEVEGLFTSTFHNFQSGKIQLASQG